MDTQAVPVEEETMAKAVQCSSWSEQPEFRLQHQPADVRLDSHHQACGGDHVILFHSAQIGTETHLQVRIQDEGGGH